MGSFFTNESISRQITGASIIAYVCTNDQPDEHVTFLSRLHYQPSGSIGRVLRGPDPPLDVLPHHAGTQSGLERGPVGGGPVHQGLRLGAAAGHRPHSMGRRHGRRRHVRGEEAHFDVVACRCRRTHQSKCMFGDFDQKSSGLFLIWKLIQEFAM